MEEPADDGVGRLEPPVVVFVFADAQQRAQPRADAEVQDVGDPFQDDLAAGVLGAQVEAGQEASEVQSAASAAGQVDELLEQGYESACVHLLDRRLDVGIGDKSALRAHGQQALVALAGLPAERRHQTPRSSWAASSAGMALRNGRMRERP
ncbi:hypothetical protein [Streptomyces sp. NPDC020362]|uniref:hypothetical protein n=1 Tax=unclassified Streptomyces TaxID=2593676 RepID=UPI0033F494D9